MIDVGRRGDPLAPAIWFLVAEAGHVGCGGWTFDRRGSQLRCICGTALYEFHEGPAMRPPIGVTGRGPARKAATDDPD
jgi:hypothetical protein